MRRPPAALLIPFCLLWLSPLSRCAAAEPQLSFEKDVRPILKANCFHCHGEEAELQGGLDVRLRRLLVAGGDSGPAVVPGSPEASLLWDRVQRDEMPPAEVEKRLSQVEREALRNWIAAGAPTAEQEPEEAEQGLYVTEHERSHWSFQPLAAAPPPQVARGDAAQTAVDLFLLERLEAEAERGFSPRAERSALLRRLCFDLTGLPPTPEQTREFLDDARPDAYSRLVERLLSSPAYGERWARVWLDLAGYADSEGRTLDDPERPHAWKYRDYVVESFNRGKPLDQFIVEQLAGDELVAPPYHELRDGEVDKLIATGFLRMAPDGTAAPGADAGLERNQVVAGTIEIVTSSLLGMTVACAQCHNHRYDPISQADYYRLRAIFEPALNWKQWKTPAQRRISLYSPADKQRAAEVEAAAKQLDADRLERQQKEIARVFAAQLAKLPAELQAPVRAAWSTPEKKRSAAQKKLLQQHPRVNVTAGSLYLYDKKAADALKTLADEAAELRRSKPREAFVRGLCEPPQAPAPTTHVFQRGDHEQPGESVSPGELTVLSQIASSQGAAPQIPLNDPAAPTTGRRLAYARWLTSGRHPLVARVLANRVWLQFFGAGLVATPDDFGMLGAAPTHPALLDYLAAELQRDWDLKRLQRLLVHSAAYQQTSRRVDPEFDPNNVLLGRMPIRRLEAESLRDAMLAASGALNLERCGPPVPVMADLVGQFVIGVENLNAGRPGPVIPMKGQELRRSIYIQSRRSRPLAVLDTFDLPAMTPNCKLRTSSTVATQALLMMNSPAVVRHGDRMAQRLRVEHRELDGQIRAAYLAAFAAPPSEEELSEARAYVAAQTERLKSLPQSAEAPDPTMSALSSLCHALLSSNRFLYVD